MVNVNRSDYRAIDECLYKKSIKSVARCWLQINASTLEENSFRETGETMISFTLNNQPPQPKKCNRCIVNDPSENDVVEYNSK